MEFTPASEITHRIQGLQTILDGLDLDGALILQKVDLFYYTGTTQTGWLYVPAQGAPLFMVFKDLERARAESGLDPDRIVPLLSAKKIPDTLEEFGFNLPRDLGMELDVLPANLYLSFQLIFAPARLTDVSTEIRLQRAVKSAHELGLVRRAAAQSDLVAAQVPEIIREGMAEIELAAELEAHARRLGHQGQINMRLFDNRLFYGHILAGDQGGVPGAFSSPTSGSGLNPMIGQGPSFNTIAPHQPVLVDYVFALDGYLADHTRIFSLGPLDEDLAEAHAKMLEVQSVFADAAGPGVVSGALYEKMVECAVSLGLGDQFMGAAHPRIRFSGHGIGIELDEFPFIAKGQTLELAPGMVIALEPKAVFPGRGVVGIENTFVVTETGVEQLTLYPEAVCIL